MGKINKTCEHFFWSNFFAFPLNSFCPWLIHYHACILARLHVKKKEGIMCKLDLITSNILNYLGLPCFLLQVMLFTDGQTHKSGSSLTENVRWASWLFLEFLALVLWLIYHHWFWTSNSLVQTFTAGGPSAAEKVGKSKPDENLVCSFTILCAMDQIG